MIPGGKILMGKGKTQHCIRRQSKNNRRPLAGDWWIRVRMVREDVTETIRAKRLHFQGQRKKRGKKAFSKEITGTLQDSSSRPWAPGLFIERQSTHDLSYCWQQAESWQKFYISLQTHSKSLYASLKHLPLEIRQPFRSYSSSYLYLIQWVRNFRSLGLFSCRYRRCHNIRQNLRIFRPGCRSGCERICLEKSRGSWRGGRQRGLAYVRQLRYTDKSLADAGPRLKLLLWWFRSMSRKSESIVQ